MTTDAPFFNDGLLELPGEHDGKPMQVDPWIIKLIEPAPTEPLKKTLIWFVKEASEGEQSVPPRFVNLPVGEVTARVKAARRASGVGYARAYNEQDNASDPT